MHGLGELESAVMTILWHHDEPRTVRAVLEELPGRRLAYTTVLTVLDNLHSKSWVSRERVGRAWAYRSARTRQEAGAQALREVLDASGDSEAVLLHFARTMNSEQTRFLRRALDDEADPS